MEHLKTQFTFQILQSSIEIDEQNLGVPTTVSESEAFVFCITNKETTAAQSCQRLHPHLVEAIQQLSVKKVFTGETKQVHIIPTLGLSPYAHIILLGLGEYSAAETIKTGNYVTSSIVNNYRDTAARLTRLIKKYKIESLTVNFASDLFIASPLVQLESIVQAFTEGVLLGGYQMKSYSRDRETLSSLREVHYLIEQGYLSDKDVDKEGEAVQQAIELSIKRAEIYALSTNYARDLTNLPGNKLTPSKLADEALELAEKYGFECTILDEKDIVEQGMGGLYNVGKGSIHPPRMIVLKYQGLPSSTDRLGLVGKGITFDTGGISLKKAEGMEEMIGDMGGAAALLGVMQAVGKLRPRLNLLAVIPAAENMPSGAAYKPGDVLTTMSGRTIEVLNTDAEGRIVLADGITYAKQLGANRLIDVSTLTGAVMVCLGDVATGAVTNNPDFMQQYKEAADRSGEKLWELPAYPEYWAMLKSDVADVKNATGRMAGAITAGLFIGIFAEETPWIHLDIGGTAWLQKDRGVDPKGGTGVMVRTILEFIR